MTAKDPLLSHATNSQNGKNNYGSNTTAESLSSTSSLINTTKMKAAFLSIRKLGGDAKQKTLLEKAAVYREQNPSVWAKKCQEKEKKDKEYHEIYSPDPFLEEYYQQIDDIENEEKRKKKLEKSKVSFVQRRSRNCYVFACVCVIKILSVFLKPTVT